MPGRPDPDKVERYRVAAEEALSQLDWCVGYLHRIRKTSEAQALARNRRTIEEGMRRRAGD